MTGLPSPVSPAPGFRLAGQSPPRRRGPPQRARRRRRSAYPSKQAAPIKKGGQRANRSQSQKIKIAPRCHHRIGRAGDEGRVVRRFRVMRLGDSPISPCRHPGRPPASARGPSRENLWPIETRTHSRMLQAGITNESRSRGSFVVHPAGENGQQSSFGVRSVFSSSGVPRTNKNVVPLTAKFVGDSARTSGGGLNFCWRLPSESSSSTK